jgi:DNA-binding NtrC family response regulator
MPSSFLIVDADRNFREALAIALRLDGHDAGCAGTADDGLARLRGGGIRCCVVDAHLDGADQLLAAAALVGLRVVVTSPYPELLSYVARRHPEAELLPKPFDTTALATDAVRGAA